MRSYKKPINGETRMNKILRVFSIIQALILITNQQCTTVNPNWVVKYYESGNNNYIKDMDMDSQGNVYTIGTKANTNGIYVKYDLTGAKIWSKQYGSGTKVLPLSIEVDSLSNEYFYVLGTTEASDLNSNSAQENIYIQKLKTQDGGLLWSKYWNKLSQGQKISLSPDGSKILILGFQQYFNPTGQTNSPVLMLVGHDGQYYSAYTYGSASTSYTGLFPRSVIFDSTGEYLYETMSYQTTFGTKPFTKKTQLQSGGKFTTSYISEFGTANNVGNFFPQKGPVLALDDSLLISPYYNVNTDYKIGANQETSIICFIASTGAVNWWTHIGDATAHMSPSDGDLSPDGSKYYYTFQRTITTSVTTVLTFKTIDGSLLRHRQFGPASTVPYSLVVTSTDRLLIGGFTVSNSLTTTSVYEASLLSWDYLMADQTCNQFSFVSTQPASIVINSVTTAALIATTALSLKIYEINEPLQTVATVTPGTNSLVYSNVYSVCTTDALIFQTTLSNQVVMVGDTFSATQSAFCYDGPGKGGASVVYSSTLLDGTSLPTWLTFTPATRAWSGSPSTAGLYYISLLADYTISAAHHYVVSNYVLIVKNNAPQLQYAIPSFTQKVGFKFSYQLDSNTFGDSDGDTIYYKAAMTSTTDQPLPSWLYFYPSTRTFEGTPPDTQSVDVIIYGYDILGQSASSTFNILLTNTQPVINTQIPDMIINTGEQFNYKIPSSYYSDVDGHKLVLSTDIESTANLKSWLYFTYANNQFKGIPTSTVAGTYPITVTITDTFTGGTVTDVFSLTINTKPIFKLPSTYIPSSFNFAQGSNTISLSSYFEDIDASSVLTYSIIRANQVALGTWLTQNSATGLLTINAGPSNAGHNYLTVTATDNYGATYSQNTDIIINGSPVLNGITSVSELATSGIPFAWKLPTGTFTDPELQDLSIKCEQSYGAPLPTWITYDSLQVMIYGTPTSSDIGSYILNLNATDPFGSTSPNFFVNLEVKSNNAPQIRSGESMRAISIRSMMDFSFEIPDSLFQDLDGESIVLNLLLADGSDLPTWMKFTPENRRVYGTALTNLTSISLKILATDPKKSIASTTFTLNIAKNKAPLVLNEIGNVNAYMNMYFEYQIPETIFRDEDGDDLSYTLTQFDSFNQIPPWLHFIRGNRTVNGFPKDGEGQTLKFKIFADDGRGGVSYQVLYLVINPNYDLAKLIPLILFGLLPLVGIFGFSFAMAFVKVPTLGNEHILQGKTQVDFDQLRMALEEQIRYKKRQEAMK
eukprot:403359511